ncbi:hypothetical protein SRHO_G00240810 [Serrasalmus rhombeus]
MRQTLGVRKPCTLLRTSYTAATICNGATSKRRDTGIYARPNWRYGRGCEYEEARLQVQVFPFRTLRPLSFPEGGSAQQGQEASVHFTSHLPSSPSTQDIKCMARSRIDDVR